MLEDWYSMDRRACNVFSFGSFWVNAICTALFIRNTSRAAGKSGTNFMLTLALNSEISFIAQLGDVIDGQVNEAQCHADVNPKRLANVNSLSIHACIDQQANDGRGGTEKALAAIVRCLENMNRCVSIGALL